MNTVTNVVSKKNLVKNILVNSKNKYIICNDKFLLRLLSNYTNKLPE